MNNIPFNFSLILVKLLISYEKNHTSITKKYFTYNNPLSIVNLSSRSALSSMEDVNILRSTFTDNLYKLFSKDQDDFINKLEQERIENLEVDEYYEKEHKKNAFNEKLFQSFINAEKEPYYESDDNNSDDESNEFFHKNYTIIPSSLSTSLTSFNKDKSLAIQVINFFHFLLLKFNYLHDNIKRLIFHFLNLTNLKNFKVLFYLFLNNDFLYHYFYEEKILSVPIGINSEKTKENLIDPSKVKFTKLADISKNKSKDKNCLIN